MPLRQALTARVVRLAQGARETTTPLPGVTFFYVDAPTPPSAFCWT